MSLFSWREMFHADRQKSRANYSFMDRLMRLPPSPPPERKINHMARAMPPIMTPKASASMPFPPLPPRPTPTGVLVATTLFDGIFEITGTFAGAAALVSECDGGGGLDRVGLATAER